MPFSLVPLDRCMPTRRSGIALSLYRLKRRKKQRAGAVQACPTLGVAHDLTPLLPGFWSSGTSRCGGLIRGTIMARFRAAEPGRGTVRSVQQGLFLRRLIIMAKV